MLVTPSTVSTVRSVSPRSRSSSVSSVRGCSVSSSGGVTGSCGGGGGWRTCGWGWDWSWGVWSVGVFDSSGVGWNGTQPYPEKLISTHASTSAPVRTTRSAPACSSLGVKPSTTRAGRPISRAMSAIAEAYCSLSPTMGTLVSRVVMRSAPCPDRDGKSPDATSPWLNQPSSDSQDLSEEAMRAGDVAEVAISAARSVTACGTPLGWGSRTDPTAAGPSSSSATTGGTTTSAVHVAPSGTPWVSTAVPVASL